MAGLTEAQQARIDANRAEALRRKAALAQAASPTAAAGQERFTFGKHSGKTFEEVAEGDAGYCSWAQQQESASGQLGQFIKFLAGLEGRGSKRSLGIVDDAAVKRQCVQEIARPSAPQVARPTAPQIARPSAPRRVSFRLQHQYLEHIKSGVKRWEGRLNMGAAAGASPGAVAVFSSGRENLEMAVQSVRKYGSFEAMLQDLGVETCLPGVSSLSRGVAIYHGFPGFAEKERMCGVIAMELAPP